jgi:8-oxo-dGTP diphosphatase
MQLPNTYLIIDKSVWGEACAEKIISACKHGIRLIRLRAHLQTDDEYLAYIKQLLPLAQQWGAKVIIDRIAYLDLGADGLHLSSHDLMNCQLRPISSELYLSASTHDLTQLQQAARLGVDFVTLSCVKKTPSHPEATPLGWTQFSQLAKQVSIPVYALGGVKAEDLAIAQQHHAYGIAGIRGI